METDEVVEREGDEDDEVKECETCFIAFTN